MTRSEDKSRILRAAVLLGIAVVTLRPALASSPPDWLNEILKAPAPPAVPEITAHWLLREATVRFLPDGKINELVREVVRIDAADDKIVVPTGHPFNADTDRIVRAHAWIVSPDGHKTTAYSRGDFFDVAAKAGPYYWNNYRMIGFGQANEAAVGGTLAWELEIERHTGLADTSWFFFTTFPEVRSIFEVVPSPGGQLTFHASSPLIPAPTVGGTAGSLRWQMRDLRPLPGKLPGGFIPNPRQVIVRNLAATPGASQLKTWGDISEKACQIVAPRIVVTPVVAAEAQAAVRGKTDRWDRIRALAEMVQKQIAYLSLTPDRDSFAGMRPRLPEEVLQSHLGDCKDKSVCLVALLRSIGEVAHPVLVRANNPSAVMPDWPSMNFNHVVVAIAADAKTPESWPTVDGGALGRWVIFDPTDTITPLGVLPPVDQLGFGLVLVENSPGLVAMPVEKPENAGLVRRLTGELNAQNELTARVDEVATGSSGSLRQHRVVGQGPEKIRQQLAERLHASLPLLSDLNCAEEWEPAAARAHTTYSFKAAAVAKTAGPDLWLLCPRLVAGDVVSLNPWKTDAEGAVWLTAGSVDEEVRLMLPAGFTVQNLPKDWTRELPCFQATLTYRLEGHALVYTRKIVRTACLLERPEYEAMADSTRQLTEAERRPALLRRDTPLSASTSTSPPQSPPEALVQQTAAPNR